MAVTQNDIFRRFCLYQKSWTGDEKYRNTEKPNTGNVYQSTTFTDKQSTKTSRPSSRIDNVIKVFTKDVDNARRPSSEIGHNTYTNFKEKTSTPSSPVQSWRPSSIPLTLNDKRSTPKTALEELEDRRQYRITRRKPWTEKATLYRPNRKYQIEYLYESNLPDNLEDLNVKLQTRKYVTNPKYGNLYEIRHEVESRKSPSPQTHTWMWEQKFHLWLYDKNPANQQKGKIGWPSDTDRTAPVRTSKSEGVIQGPSSGPQPHTAQHTTSAPKWTSPTETSRSAWTTSPTTPRSTWTATPTETPRSARTSRTVPSRPGSINKSKQNSQSTPIHDKPHADLFAHYHSYRLQKQRQKEAAVLVQKFFRGWRIRNHLKLLKRKALFEHGCSWSKFIKEYRELVTRIQSRHGEMRPSCRLNLKEVEIYMDQKYKYERAYDSVSYGNKLLKSDLGEFFEVCGMYPTDGELASGFDSVFKGTGATAEIVFVLDCSSSVGKYNFAYLMKFVKDIISTFNIGPDMVRVGVIPFTEDIYQAFGITTHYTKEDILNAVDAIKPKEGLTRTDLALKLMKSMLGTSRPGVDKIGVVISDAKSSEPELTKASAKKAHTDNIEVFAIGVGEKVDIDEHTAMATSQEHILRAYDYRSLGKLKDKLTAGIFKGSAKESNNPANIKSKCRPLTKSEAMEVFWTVYPPSASCIDKKSRWIRPVIEGTEAWSMLDKRIRDTTDIRTCLRLVIQSKLEREGHIMLPSNKEDVKAVSNPDEALAIIEQWMKSKQGLA